MTRQVAQTAPRSLKRLWRDPSALLGLTLVLGFVLLALLAPLYPRDPVAADATKRLHPPSLEYPLGLDHLGRDNQPVCCTEPVGRWGLRPWRP